jgi:hypothetical protein
LGTAGVEVSVKGEGQYLLSGDGHGIALTLPGEFLDTLDAEVERWVEKLRSEAASFSLPPTAPGPAIEAVKFPH